MSFLRCSLFLLTFLSVQCFAQDSSAYKWQISSKRITPTEYELILSTPGTSWQLYAPGQVVGGVALSELSFADSSVEHNEAFTDSGKVTTIRSELFEGAQVQVSEGAVTWKKRVRFQTTAPEKLIGTLLYSYGRGNEFYQGTYSFSVALEGGKVTTSRILIPTIDLRNTVADCGDDIAEDKSLLSIFLLGFIGGLIALITPCVFPLIPLTVSFFTKRSASRKKGIRNALFYGACILAIYALLSIPFHLLDKTDPEILNNISTNVTLNLIFFVVFIVFALSFFGFYEIVLPGSFANKVDSKSGIGDFAGIFFMALTLAIVSFSCTGPILGSLLAGALTNNGGAWQLTSGMSGFGLGLALPFALFALFPGWLQSMPKSGGWLTSVKVVLGFLELAMAIKFLSNADLVKQWGLLKREVFIAIWIIIGLAIVLYLLGVLRMPHGGKPKMTKARWGFTVFFALVTLYLVPGLTNTPAATLPLISGFPPPLSYSLYDREITIKPIHNDYEKALELARQQNKPILIDFTGWACVNCRRMEENVWVDPEVESLMRDKFIVVSLYVDERKKLPSAAQTEYVTKSGDRKPIITVGDKWATFQSENFNAVAQPQYAIISPDEKALTRTKAYTPDPEEFKEWLECGLKAFSSRE
ncbi:MAG TPA: cytochrome c biogenesis protein CcdA [Flavisolibacter sp.]